jgi:GcrA cell cycle regulator
MEMSFTWTDERVECLRKLWADGLSASQIAKELGGVTRNAVIGKVHRLGLSGRAKGPSQARLPGQKRAGRNANYAPRPPRNGARMNGDGRIRGQGSASRAALLAAQEIIEAPEPIKVDLIQLTDRTCKWPYGDPVMPDFFFCGHEVAGAPPYCRYHARLAFQPIADRRRTVEQ